LEFDKKHFFTGNASWSDFPFLTTDSAGSGTIEVRGKFTSDGFIGENKIIVRLRKDETTVNTDSDAVRIIVNQPEIVLVKTDDGKKEPAIPGPFLTTVSRTYLAAFESATMEAIPSELSSSESGDVLAAEIPPLSPLTLINSPEKNDLPTDETTPFPWEAPLLLVGSFLLGGSLLTMIIRAGGWSFIRGIFLSE
jgi:hypothetical protein